PSASATATPSASATSVATPTVASDCAQGALASMTEAQRVGQLFLLGLAGDRLGSAEIDAIRTRHLGSVWFVEQSTAGVAPIRAVADAVQGLVAPDTTANARFFVAANQEGGIIQSLQGSGFSTIPAAIDQGSI